MSAPVFDRPTVDWERDRWSRPKIKPPVGQAWPADDKGRAVALKPYTRVTTFAGSLDDSQGLVDWKAAQALLGASRRPDYVMAAAACTSWDQDKATLRELVEKASEAAGESAAAIGTALHSFTERIDRGEPLGFVPEAYRPHLERYRELVAPLTFTHHEVRTVCDELEVAGTPDRFGYCSLPDPDGVSDRLRVIDTKSGKLGPGVLKMGAQLAIYAHSQLYDPATGERTPLENLDTRWGLITHLPAKATAAELATGAGGLYWLRLDHGWEGAQQLAGRVRAWRKARESDLLVPVSAVQPATDVPDERQETLQAARTAILGAPTTSDLGQLWQRHAADWKDVPELVQMLQERHAELAREQALRAPRAALLGALSAATAEELGQLWSEHQGTDLWTDEHDAAGRARYAELSGVAA